MNMARSRRLQRKKYDWMHYRVNLEWTTADTSNAGSNYSDSLYIDGARALSILNRKLVKQGQLFRISNMQIWSDEADTSHDFRIKIGTLPTTWVMRNAWVKSKALFDEMNAEALMNVGGPSALPKWHDYKVFMNNAHKTQVTTGGTDGIEDDSDVPVDLDNNELPYGEWVYSKFQDSGSSSDEYYVHAMGDHEGSTGSWTSVGLIQAYAESRIIPVTAIGDPQLPADTELSPWGRLFGDDDQTQKLVNHLDADNDMPPYDRDDYPGGGTCTSMCVYTGRLQEGNIPIASPGIRNFVAPLGLIQIELDKYGSGHAGVAKVHISFDIEPIAPMDA